MIISYEIPQADVLSDVVETVRFINENHGASDKSIASHLAKVPRQGRYYRHAAVLLGFIKNNRNSAFITNDGIRLLKLNDKERQEFLRDRILRLKAFQMSLELIGERNGCTRKDLEKMLTNNKISISTGDRRTSTIINWLLECEMVFEVNGKLFPTKK